MRILVVGGAGFIGPYIVRAALADGGEPAVYDNFLRGKRSSLAQNVKVFEGDVCNGADLRQACLAHHPDVIIHAAAHHFIPWCIEHPHETLETNVGGTLVVARTAATMNVRSVVFTSTADVYAPQVKPHAELDPLGSSNVYGMSKIAGETILEAFAAGGAFSLYILRLFNVLGLGDTNPHFVPELIANARRGPRIPVGNLLAVRDYVHAKDVASACVRAAQGLFPPGRYNVATGVGHSGEMVLDELRRISGLPLTTVLDDARLRPSDRPVLVGNTSRLVSTGTWEPSTTLSGCLQDLWEHSA